MKNNNGAQSIRLTTQHLERYGFVFNQEGEDVFHQIWEKRSANGTRVRLWEYWEDGAAFCLECFDTAPLDYCHQLESLYFALTGEKLINADLHQTSTRKPLSQITLSDALQVAQSAYIAFSKPEHNWTLEDRSKEIDTPCAVLISKKNLYSMWFFDDRIDIDHEDEPITIVDAFDSADVQCYVTAWNLGYDVPQFHNLHDTPQPKRCYPEIIEAVERSLPHQPKDKPYLVQGGNSYTLEQLLQEMRNGTEFGLKTQEALFKLTIDLLMRGKEKLPE